MQKFRILFALAVIAVSAGLFRQETQDFPLRDSIRIWTDSTGKHTREGFFLGLDNGIVTLRKPDGQEPTIRLDQLSEADQKIVQCFAAPRHNPECEVTTPFCCILDLLLWQRWPLRFRNFHLATHEKKTRYNNAMHRSRGRRRLN